MIIHHSMAVTYAVSKSYYINIVVYLTRVRCAVRMLWERMCRAGAAHVRLQLCKDPPTSSGSERPSAAGRMVRVSQAHTTIITLEDFWLSGNANPCWLWH